MSFLKNFQNSIYFLIQKASTDLPLDIITAMDEAKNAEISASNAEFSLKTLSTNIQKAKQKTVPMCQDTGFLTFYVSYSSPEISEKKLSENIILAVQKATKDGLLRPNAVDSITGKNSGDNTGIAIPKIIFERKEDDSNVSVKLILKGGGSENVSAQHALPCQTDFGRAGRDLEGVKKVVLQTVKNAEGKGCAPGILGIHIGGDRATGYEKAKLNFFRNLSDKNPENSLQFLEKELLEESNNLGIGPMGFGGKSTILSAKVSASHRIPASFFVTIAYSCWALRRGEIFCSEEGEIISHSWEDSEYKKCSNPPSEEGETRKMSFPFSEKDVMSLKSGDKILLSGTIFTGRDTIHHYVVEEGNDLPKDISGSAIYHCGPVMKQDEISGEWSVVAAGPTTSIREEPYQADFLKKTGARAIIGKGGMGEKTLKGLQENKAVYLHAIGGAAAVYAEKIQKIHSVNFLEEFGVPEALWEMEISDFPVIVTMDAHGNRL